jgi:fructose/tagatose bisphosphate aldolase
LKTVKIIGTPKVPGDPDYHNDAKCKKLNAESKVFTSVMVDGKKAWLEEIQKNCKKYFDKCK